MGISRDHVIQGDAVPHDFFCPICDDLIEPRDATQVGPCGHLFCGGCITSSVNIYHECPQDRRPVAVEQLLQVKDSNPFVYRLLGRTRVKCENVGNGCEWEGEVSEASQHRVVCSKRMLVCARCKDSFRRDLAEEHQLTCRACKECEEKEAKITLLLKEKLSLSSKFLLVSETLRSLQSYDRNYKYNCRNLVELGQLIARNILSKPPEIDSSRVFNCIKECFEEWKQGWSESPDSFDSQMLFVVSAADVSTWFSEPQVQQIQQWLKEICEHQMAR